MLRLPANLTPDEFLKRYWQKQALFMPGALNGIRPSISRNELGWLATMPDVESRLVFVNRQGDRTHYYTESGPFDAEYLRSLPKRDWTLIVHDVEKHLPEMRALFRHVPFIPDWRIDDLMVSFAAPGGGVGPHRDQYDVFLCQGIGIRNWRYSSDNIIEDEDASSDLALLREFEGKNDDSSEGDVLYLPPGVAHWGTARRACMTYSIGMRAPHSSDFSAALDCTTTGSDGFYKDPDLRIDEARPGYISNSSTARAMRLMGRKDLEHDDVAAALGHLATQPKDWLAPEGGTLDETEKALDYLKGGGQIDVHGMAQVAFDDRRIYLNGQSTRLPPGCISLLEEICTKRALSSVDSPGPETPYLLRWLFQHGAFEIPENF